MASHSLDYFLFLYLAAFVYWLVARWSHLRLAWLLFASCAFYMAWQPAYVLLILGSTLLDFSAGLCMAKTKRVAVKKAWLVTSLIGNLGLLFSFKYFNFVSQQLFPILNSWGLPGSPPLFDVLLPIGISFYTFQTMSYTIDVYRGAIQPTRSLLQFACFVTYFPQLVAGPIVRATELLPQLAQRPTINRQQVGQALFLLGLGLTKKIAIADYLSVNLVDRVFDQPAAYSAAEVCLGLYGFTMQIYCDFSGYTDLARGSAMLMGIRLPENFDRPYWASNPAEFWRRWHMTLSSWLRDYLYFPLGGSRGSPLRTYVNLWLTIFLIGIWHGASWTFVLYGSLQATAVALHRLWFRYRQRQGRSASTHGLNHVLKVFLCLQFIVLSRILFRAKDLTEAKEVGLRLLDTSWGSMHQLSWSLWLVLGGSFMLHYLPKSWTQRAESMLIACPIAIQLSLLIVLAFALSLIANSQTVPYIYFQF